MSITWFEDNTGTETVDAAVKAAVADLEYKIASEKVSKIANAEGDKFVESTSGGDIKESYMSTSELHSIKSMLPDTSRATVGQSILYAGNGRLGVGSKPINQGDVIREIRMWTEFWDTVVLKSSDFTNRSSYLFPINQVADKDMEISRVSVVLKFRSDVPVRTNGEWLDPNNSRYLIIKSWDSGNESVVKETGATLTPFNARTFTPANTHPLTRGERFNAKLEFHFRGKAWKLLDVAIVKLFYRYK